MTDTQQRARIAQINVNPRGGVPKQRVEQADVLVNGVRGDKQRNLRVHGGPARAVCLYSAELIDALRDEGHLIAPGTTGENLTISGLDWAAIKIGDRLRVGDTVELEITAYTAPCQNIADSFIDGEFKRIGQRPHPGWSRLYARVLREGSVRAGDAVEMLHEGHEEHQEA